MGDGTAFAAVFLEGDDSDAMGVLLIEFSGDLQGDLDGFVGGAVGDEEDFPALGRWLLWWVTVLIVRMAVGDRSSIRRSSSSRRLSLLDEPILWCGILGAIILLEDFNRF